MDPITTLQVAAAVIAFADISYKIAKRLSELSEAGDVPQSFREVRTRLPLIRSLVISTEQACGNLSSEVKHAFNQLVIDCHGEIEQLEKILTKVTVAHGDSRFKKGMKATVSMFEDAHVKRIGSTLQTNVELLMAIKTTSTELEKLPPSRRPSEAPPAYSSTTGVFLLPFERDEHFVGRSDVLENIYQKLQIQSRVAVAGIGGVGKSQVAIEFGYRFKHDNPNAHVFWVYGGNISRFYQGYKSIAQSLAIPSWDDPDISVLELVSDWFQQATTDFLLIVDNADNITHWWPGAYRSPSSLDDPSSNLSDFLPENNEHGRLLITTRDNRVATRLLKQGKPITLETMTSNEAQQLFMSLASDDGSQFEEKEVRDLVQELDYLPLAISQAASFIEANMSTIAEYLAAIQSAEPEEFLYDEQNDARRDKDNLNSVFRTWKLSFDNIRLQKPAAAELLSLMAMLDRQSVPKWLLAHCKDHTTSLGFLRAFHLITMRTGSQSFQMHRLVQKFVQLTLKQEGTEQKWQQAALTALCQSYPTEIGVAQWPVCDALAPHVQIVTNYEYKSPESRLELAHLLCWAADFDVERGMYTQALRRSKRSLDIFRDLVEAADERRVSATWMYGRLQYYQAESENELNRAAETLKEALRTSIYPSLTYGETAFELAHLYFDQCNKEGCLEMGRASFECWKAMEGASSVRTLDNMHDFALELALFGDVDEALAKWQEIVDQCHTSDASENTKTVYTYRSMASIAEFQGDASMAESFYKKLITLCTNIYNAQHIHVFDYRLTHAEQILRQGRLEEATQLCLDILASCENKSEWQIRATCLQVLAECCRLQDKFDAELFHRHESLQLHESKLGRKHKMTINELEAYGKCCLSNGKHETAATVFAEILDWRNGRLNHTHQDIVRAIEFEGICCMEQGQDHEAESRFLDALDRQGGTDPRLLDNLIACLANQGKWGEMEDRCRQALGSAMGQSPQTHSDLMFALEQQGKMEETLALRADGLGLQEVKVYQSGPRRRPMEPPVPASPRFGRMIHPRTWSA